jgi:glutamine amidotransferase
MKSQIAILASRGGNRFSVLNAFEKVGAEAFVSDEPERILESDGLVLPGVGAFPAVMNDLRQRDLLKTLDQFRELGKPILGICLGMQLFFDNSWELTKPGDSPTEGLGWLKGTVRPFNDGGRTFNMGWSPVSWQEGADLGINIPAEEAFYHVHGCVCQPDDLDVAAAYSDSSEDTVRRVFVSAVQQDNLYGVQFHPERSGIDAGLVVVKNFHQLVLNS